MFKRKLFLPASGLFLSTIFIGMCFSQSTWELIKPIQENSLYSVTYGKNQFVAVGINGTILVSTNGLAWTIKNSGTTKDLGFAAYGNNLFVVVGQDGTILTSPNGTIWTAINSGTKRKLNAVNYANNRFVVVGDSGTILTSTSGTTWESKKSETTNNLNSVAFGNNQFLVVGDYGGTYGGLIKMASEYSALLTSADGSVWNQTYTETNWQRTNLNSIGNNLRSVAYGDSLFVIVGDENLVVSSPNAKIWAETYISTFTNFNIAIYGNGKFVALGSSGLESIIITSVDGIKWEIKNLEVNSLISLTYGNGLFVAVGGNGIIMTSKAENTGEKHQNSITPAKINAVKIICENNNILAIIPQAALHNKLKVELFNVSGKRIYGGVIQGYNGILTIPFRGLSEGKFILVVTTNNNRTLMSSFVVSR